MLFGALYQPIFDPVLACKMRPVVRGVYRSSNGNSCHLTSSKYGVKLIIQLGMSGLALKIRQVAPIWPWMEQTHAQVIENRRPEIASRNKATADLQNPQ